MSIFMFLAGKRRYFLGLLFLLPFYFFLLVSDVKADIQLFDEQTGYNNAINFDTSGFTYTISTTTDIVGVSLYMKCDSRSIGAYIDDYDKNLTSIIASSTNTMYGCGSTYAWRNWYFPATTLTSGNTYYFIFKYLSGSGNAYFQRQNTNIDNHGYYFDKWGDYTTQDVAYKIFDSNDCPTCETCETCEICIDCPDYSTVQYSQDLTLISATEFEFATTSTSSPIGYKTTYYHIPALFLFFIAMILIWILSRLIIELLIRWRQ